jgi:hypothetical protein
MMTRADVEEWIKTFGTQERTRLWRRDELGMVLVWVEYLSKYCYMASANRFFYGLKGI